MVNKSITFIIAIFAGLVTTTAGIGMGLYSYQWWDEVRILYPAYGGRWLILPILTEICWIGSITYLVLLALTCIAATSKICGEQLPRVVLVFVCIGVLLTLGSSVALVIETTEKECQKMRDAPKNKPSSDVLNKWRDWLEDYTDQMDPDEKDKFRFEFDYYTCDKHDRNIWIWVGFTIASVVSGIAYIIFYQIEKKRFQDVLEGTPLSQGNYHYH